MGFDKEVFILSGFKLKLSDVFEKGWLDPSIMEEDWQCLNMGDDLDQIIEKYVNNEDLKTLLSSGWALYILASTQEDIDFDKSYLFVYIDKQEIDCDGEYATEVLNVGIDMKLSFPGFEPLGLETDDWKYHGVFNSSW